MRDTASQHSERFKSGGTLHLRFEPRLPFHLPANLFGLLANPAAQRHHPCHAEQSHDPEHGRRGERALDRPKAGAMKHRHIPPRAKLQLESP